MKWKVDPKLALAVGALAVAGGVAVLRGGGQPAFTTEGTSGARRLPASAPPASAGDGASVAAVQGSAAGAQPAPWDRGSGGAARAEAPDVVYVAGAVARPGVYRLSGHPRVEDAIRRAGGSGGAADLDAINLAAPLRDGDMVLVPRRGDATDLARVAALDEGPGDAAAAPRRHSRKHRKRKRRKAALVSSVSSNGGGDAGAVAGIGDGRGAANGGLAGDASANDTSASPGTAPHRRRRHRSRHATLADVDPAPSPVDLNTADENELEGVPGIGPELASRIVAFRELNGPFASTDELLDVAGFTDSKLAAVAEYLEIR